MGIFGNRLKEARTYRGITQEQLAEMADITRNMVGRYETTDQLPSLETLIRIADALSASTDFLLGRTETMDATFSGHFEQPKKSSSAKMPKNTIELDTYIRTIIKDELIKSNLIEGEHPLP